MDGTSSWSAGDDKLLLFTQRELSYPPSYDHYDSPSTPNSGYSASTMSTMSPILPVNFAQRVMTDEERYPTVVETIQPPLPVYTRHRTQESSGGLMLSNIDVEEMSNIESNHRDSNSPQSQSDSQQLFQQTPEKKTARKCFGLPKRRFIWIISILGAAVILGIIAAVVVILKLKKTSSTSKPSIAVAGLYTGINDTDWNMQLVYTNTTTGEIKLRLLIDEEMTWSDSQTLNLTIMPDTIDAPMSAVSTLGSDGNIYLGLFYIQGTNVVLANVSCINATTSCSIVNNTIISQQITYPMATDSGLSAVHVYGKGYRVYYHNADRYVTQLSSQGDNVWDRGTPISGKALAGSSISATAVGEKNMVNILYVDMTAEALYSVVWQNQQWWSPSAITNDTVPNWDPTSSLSSAYLPASDKLVAYFTGSDKLIYQFAGLNVTSSSFPKVGRVDYVQNASSGISTPGWTESPIHDLTWLPTDSVGAKVTAVAWGNELGFWRLIGGKMAQSSLISGAWSAKFV